jgi:4-amino-4-deoxy-L-arabinose transferase-like glycosyltransferase
MDRPPLLRTNTELMGKEELHVSALKKEQSWWQSWEFYLIVLLAVVLRFYRIDTAQYMADHNSLYQMAHDGVANGLWPITANGASTGLLLPPLFVYLMMIPAAITPNPVAGNILIALCNVLAVLLTYVFVRRYYGRLAGAIAALLYATAGNVIVFSRDIWQPDMLPLCMILLLFVLFRGIVEKKHYWFLPAVLLLGIMYQFHSTAIYLIVLLLAATLLGFKTIRWRELPLALLGLSVLFAPYIYLESLNHLADIRILFHVADSKAAFNGDVLQHYRTFVSSYVSDPLRTLSDTHLIPSNNHSILLTTPLHFIAQFDVPESWLMVVLLVAGVFTLIIQLFWTGRSPERKGLATWLKSLLASPWNRGAILLLAWQGTILLFLRHSTFIYAHYLLYLIPGPFIIIGILSSNVMRQRQHLPLPGKVLLRYGLYVFIGLAVIIQTVGSAGWLVDHMLGNFNINYARPQYFDLATMQRLVNISDRMALKRHLGHVYFDIHGDDVSSVSYLAQFAHTPMEVLDSSQCMVIPSAQSGPAVYVTDPNRPDLNALLEHYTLATRIGDIPYPGGPPFPMYIVKATPTSQPSLQLSGGVQLVSHNADVFPVGVSALKILVTRWRIQNAQSPQPRTTYIYNFLSRYHKNVSSGTGRICRLSSTSTGDQLIPLFLFRTKTSRSLIMNIEKFSSSPQHYDHGSFKMVTFKNIDTVHTFLHIANGQNDISLITITVIPPVPHGKHRKVPIHPLVRAVLPLP